MALLMVPPSSPMHLIISPCTSLVGKWFSILSMTIQFHIPVGFLISSPEVLAAITCSFCLKSMFFNIKVSVLFKSAFSTSSIFSWVWGEFFLFFHFLSYNQSLIKGLIWRFWFLSQYLLLEVVLAFLSPWLQFFSMLWPLPASATVIRWHLLFRLFCTRFSLTKRLLIYFLLPHTWRIPSCLLILSLGLCLLTLQRFFSPFPVFSLASCVPPDPLLPQYFLPPLFCSLPLFW